MNIKALILDAGGVLVRPLDGDWTIPVAYRELPDAYAKQVGGAAWQAASRAEMDCLREDLPVPDMETEYRMRRQFLGAVARRLRWTLSEDMLTRLAKDFTYNPDRYDWYSDTDEYLARWQGKYRIGVLSDALPSFKAFARARVSDALIEQIVISVEVGCCKPDPRMYREICARMGVAPRECLFVDDRAANLEGAQRAGMRAVQMARDGMKPSFVPAARDLRELDALLEATI